MMNRPVNEPVKVNEVSITNSQIAIWVKYIRLKYFSFNFFLDYCIHNNNNTNIIIMVMVKELIKTYEGKYANKALCNRKAD